MPDEINTFFPAADCGAARADFAFEMDTKMESQWEKVRREGGGQLGRSGADQSDSYSKERSLIGMLNKLRSTRSTQPISSSVQPRNESKIHTAQWFSNDKKREEYNKPLGENLSCTTWNFSSTMRCHCIGLFVKMASGMVQVRH